MLFVAHAEGERREVNVVLQHGVRAAEDVDLPRRERRLQVPLFLRRTPARKVSHAILGKGSFEQREVLCREHFRGRKIRRLKAALYRHENARERDRRLAAPDVALQQSVHAHGRGEVVVDRPHRRLLSLREREGKAFFEVGDVALGDRITAQSRLVFIPFDEPKGRNEREILLQSDPFRRILHFLCRFRRMNGIISLF